MDCVSCQELSQTGHEKDAVGVLLFARYYLGFQEKEARNVYLAYIGTKPVLTEKKARAIAKKLGVTLDDLKAVRGLRIIED
jgi:hypothetical protein